MNSENTESKAIEPVTIDNTAPADNTAPEMPAAAAKGNKLGIHPPRFLLASALIVLIIVISLAVIMFNHMDKGPQKAAKEYTKALLNGDAAAADALSTRELHIFNKDLAAKLKNAADDKSKLMRILQLNAIEQIDDGYVIIEGDHAIIFNKQNQPIRTLKKVNGKWLNMNF